MRKLLLFGVILAAIVQIGQHREFFSTAKLREITGQPTRVSTDKPADKAADKRTTTPSVRFSGQQVEADDTLAEAFAQRRSNVQVQAEGVVIKILADDNQGSRHQRFLVRVDSGQSVLIAHNIDLAPRVAGLRPGDTVEFNGEYEWNEKGGVVHWTHKDPAGRHIGGWVRKK
jgi:hypothetical protein